MAVAIGKMITRAQRAIASRKAVSTHAAARVRVALAAGGHTCRGTSALGACQPLPTGMANAGAIEAGTVALATSRAAALRAIKAFEAGIAFALATGTVASAMAGAARRAA